ncbi:MAG: choice-of-anchor J domain-containing protein [Bacteroidales bacterium]|nr:choice-of-anchor J domain-containing protein [Bacteroidales bacterium]
MKKLITFFAALWLSAIMATTMASNVVVCDGSTQLTTIPTYTFYRNSATQFIYTSNELGQANTFISISFKHYSTGAGTGIQRYWKVYLTSTTRSEYASENDWVTVHSNDLVAQGLVELPNYNSDVTVTFTNPFQYNGTSNLAVTIIDNNDDYESGHSFAGLGTDGNTPYRSVRKADDNAAFSISSVGTFSAQNYGTSNFRPRAEFGVQAAPPSVQIKGPDNVIAGFSNYFIAQVNSEEPINSYTWTTTGATPSSYTGDTASFAWATPGSYTLTLSVETNSNGTTTATQDITVRSLGTMGDTIDYTFGNEYYDTWGLPDDNGGYTGEFIWGIRIPAFLLAGRNYLSSVGLYLYSDGEYTLNVYQGSSIVDATPVYTNQYILVGSGSWVYIPVYGGYAIDHTQDLWIVFRSEGNAYPAAGVLDTGVGLYGQYLYRNDVWDVMKKYDHDITWMIQAITSATAPSAFSCDFTVPTKSNVGYPVSFSTNGPASATFSWTFNGATPATATGQTATAKWLSPGTYNVGLTSTWNGQTASATHQITIVDSCHFHLPYIEDFTNGIDCWCSIDGDGDGHTWEEESINDYTDYTSAYQDEHCIASASYWYGPITPDNWIISPRIELNASGSIILKWSDLALHTDDYREHYSVWISTTGADTSDMRVKLFERTTDTYMTWKQQSVDLTDYAGKVVYIAFRHHDCTGQDMLFIDSISITATYYTEPVGIAEAEATTTAVYPNPTSGKVHVESSEPLYQLDLYNTQGQRLLTQHGSSDIDLGQLPTGLYLLRATTASGTTTHRVMKK